MAHGRINSDATILEGPDDLSGLAGLPRSNKATKCARATPEAICLETDVLQCVDP